MIAHRMARPVVSLLLLSSLAAGAMGDAPDRRVRRKIAVVEKILDTALIESKYALVTSGDNTHGVYLEGHGAFFVLEFSLVEEPHKKILENLDDLDDLVENWRELLELDEEARAAASDRRRVLLEKVEEELIETLLDYGSTLTFLKPTEWLTLAAFPWGESWAVSPEPVRRLMIQVAASDLQENAEGRISDEELGERMTVRESSR